MRNLKINIEGKSDSDLEIALEEVLRVIKNGNMSGMDSNDSGEFNFQISGDEEPEKECCETCGGELDGMSSFICVSCAKLEDRLTKEEQEV